MDYYINPAKYAGAFAVPGEIADKHLRLAGAAQLKVLLYILRHGSPDAGSIAKALALDCADVRDCLGYWIEAGILLTAEKPAPLPEMKEPSKKRSPAVRAAAIPAREEIARRGAESKEIAYLLSEAQLKFGRIINQTEAGTLIWLHDYEGLPVSVILMIIEYSISSGRGTIKYIEKIGMDWAAREIDSLTKAEKYLVELASRSAAWRKVERAFSIEHRRPTKKEEDFSYKWAEEWKFSTAMLRAAYDICVDSTGKVSMPYIGKILEKWHKNGWKKPEEIENDEKKPDSGRSSNSSLDADEIDRMIKQGLFG